MTSKGLFMLFVAIVVLAEVVLAKEFIVGDEIGWAIGFDYQAWAGGKNFLVGNKFVFKFPVGAHNIYKVNGTGFQNNVIPTKTAALTSGNDVIILAIPGRKWYICGVGKHCEAGGQKLFITVQPTQLLAPTIAPSQAQSYTNLANGIMTSAYNLVMVAAVMAVMMVLS